MKRLAIAVLALLLAGAVPAAAEQKPLRVLDFNMHTGIGADGVLDLGRTAAQIRDSGADVVGLQEVDVHFDARSGYVDQAAELARLTGMRVYFAPIYDLDPAPGHTDRRQYGVAVLSRFPITGTDNHLITRLSTVDENPIAAPAPGFAEAVVRVRGRSLHVYVTHLDFRADPAIRSTQIAETVRILDEDRRGSAQLLLGDFNAEPDAAELRPLFGRIPDAWQGAAGPGHTFPAEAPEKRIDYITAAGLPVHSASVLESAASDHRPVFAEFGLPQPGSPSR